MNTSDFSNISMNGRMAYSILCVEKVLVAKYPDDDWSVLSKEMWKATSTYWDEWGNRFIEIIPEYLFEFDTYEESDFEGITKDEYDYFVNLLKGRSDVLNQLLLKLYELQEVYCYTSIPGNGPKASEIVLDICNTLEQNSISLPDISTVAFSNFSEKDGWGYDFDGESISIILSHN